MISVCNHPESQFSSSTVKSMIDYHAELGYNYFACVDQGIMPSILKSYNYASTMDNMHIIPGVEIFFKDDDCELIKNTPSEQIKYFKLILHARDEQAYKELIKLSSTDGKSLIQYHNEKFPKLTWKDLEYISQFNISICTADVECMITKHLLVNNPKGSLLYFHKLHKLFGDRLYLGIVPTKYDKYLDRMIKIELKNKTINLLANTIIETDKYNNVKAKELTSNRHKELKAIYLNNARYNIKEEHRQIINATSFEDYAEISSGDIQLKANQLLIQLAQHFKLENNIVINTYAFYALQSDQIVQDMKMGLDDRLYAEHYIQSPESIRNYLMTVLQLSEEMCDKISVNCNNWAKYFDQFNIDHADVYFLPDPGPNHYNTLIELIKKKGRMKWDNPQYVKQFKEELNLLTNNGKVDLIPYFLPLVDINQYYEDNGQLVGPARGSAGGFLISYLIGVTQIDPIKYGLYSERFITMDRVKASKLPDIDSDYESRDLLVGDGNNGYLQQKYGNKVAQCSTRSLLRIKSAILDVNRYVNHGTVDEKITRLSKNLPTTPQGISDHDFVFGYEDEDGTHNKGLIDYRDDLQEYALNHKEEWDIVQKSLSLTRQSSRHACAFVIADRNIEDIVPTFQVGNVKRVTQPEAKECEYAGLLKYDFLIVSAIKIIRKAIDFINKKHNDSMVAGYFNHNDNKLYVWDLPEEPAVFEMLSKGDTSGVFQLNTASATPYVEKIKPNSVIDCATITSLVRPGPLDFKDEKTGRNMVDEYTLRKHGQVQCNLPIMEELLPETYGVIVFQEQLNTIAIKLGKMDPQDAETLREHMCKKRRKQFLAMKPKFMSGAIENVGKEVAEQVWNIMEPFASYSFNKAHSVAYSVISYAMAFIKHHYPLEFWAAMISEENLDVVTAKNPHIISLIDAPDINISEENIAIDYNSKTLRNKLSSVKGLGVKAIHNIIKMRPYSDIQDFVNKAPIGNETIKKIICLGIMDSLFTPGLSLIQKMQIFEDAKEKKIYEDKINKGIKKPILKKGIVDSKYLTLDTVSHYILCKKMLSTYTADLMQLALTKVINSGSEIHPHIMFNYIANGNVKQLKLMSGNEYKQWNTELSHGWESSCAPAFVLQHRIFGYNSKDRFDENNNPLKLHGLELILDIDGQIVKHMVWPSKKNEELMPPKHLLEIKSGQLIVVPFYKGPQQYIPRIDSKLEVIFIGG